MTNLENLAQIINSLPPGVTPKLTQMPSAATRKRRTKWVKPRINSSGYEVKTLNQANEPFKGVI